MISLRAEAERRPRIGPYLLPARVLLAPMAGVTDRPFRILCRSFGAALAPSEMISSDQRLWHTPKSRHRMDHDGEPEPRVVQLTGADPSALAEAARANVALGAQIIDLNMGCPAKKVCGRSCGSALLTDEPLVARILEAVVRAVDVPVTLKIRTGWDREHRNGVNIACIAEACGVAALAVHGRTRADLFEGAAEYATIRDIKARVRMPVFANGDIDTPQKARAVLDFTSADGVMIGRASHGSPWIFRTVNAHVHGGIATPALQRSELRDIILRHLDALYSFYGEQSGVRIARKHLGWYCEQLLGSPADVRRELMGAADTTAQFAHAVKHFDDWASRAVAAA
ncbi:MAG: tRNA dihydrouridine synthase DusB [Gammaproteobacteria bacterium]|nr:tRNA dihydrouridine synthase DusB [Gammaproteobacteria bacterium]